MLVVPYEGQSSGLLDVLDASQGADYLSLGQLPLPGEAGNPRACGRENSAHTYSQALP